MSGRGKVQS
nr:unnamed protein product [Callosobruchus chinensis]